MSPTSAACTSLHTTDPHKSHGFSLADLDDQSKLIAILLYTILHFSGDIRKLFAEITDPRNPKKITYSVDELCFAATLMFMFGLEARRQVGFRLRGGLCADRYIDIFDAPDCPHGDTINDAFAGMNPAEFQNLLCWIVFGLIRKKVLYPYRLLERYLVIAIDGTRILNREKRHCPRCLHVTQDGKTTYYHMVVEAKIVTPNGFAFPFYTEFVENTDGDSKQDCELKAFYRMAEKIKAQFPRLQLVISLDGLFACGPVFGLCQDLGWKYIAVLKDKALPTVNKEFKALTVLEPEDRLIHRYLDGKIRVEQDFRWVNAINHTDTKKREHAVNVIECLQTKEEPTGVTSRSTHRWVTDLPVSRRNVVELASDGGRLRWKIENEGFNVQKNGGYGLMHMYSKNENSSKIFHYLMQISHLWMQLFIAGSLLKRWFPRGMGSVKNLVYGIQEAWRNARMPGGMLQWITQWRLQIRFCPDTS